MADFEKLRTAELEFQRSFIDYFPYVLFAPLPLKKEIPKKQALLEQAKQIDNSFRKWETENPPMDIEKLLTPYIDQEKKDAGKGIFFNLNEMDRRKPFSSFFPQVAAVGPGKRKPREIEKYNAYLARRELKKKYMDELQNLYNETKPLDPRRVGVVHFFLSKEEDLWKEGFNRSVAPDLAISGDENLPLIDDFFKMIEKRHLYAIYDSKADILKWDFSGVTEHSPHNLYAEFGYYAHKAMTCRKFGSELHWLETHPEKLPLLPLDKKATLLDYLKGEGSRQYVEEIHGGVILYKVEKPEKPSEKLEKAHVQENRRRNFLKAVNLDINWEIPLEKLYYTLFLAVKSTKWYLDEKVAMTPMKLFDAYSETNSFQGEEFIKYILFKNFDKMDKKYFYLNSHFYKLRKKYSRYKAVLIKNYKDSFIRTYKRIIDKIMEGIPKNADYSPWNIEELINIIGMQAKKLYASAYKEMISDYMEKFTRSEKQQIHKFYAKIKESSNELVRDLRKKIARAPVESETIKDLNAKKERLWTENEIKRLEDKITEMEVEYDQSPKEYWTVLEMEYVFLEDYPEVLEKIESKTFKNRIDTLYRAKNRIKDPDDDPETDPLGDEETEEEQEESGISLEDSIADLKDKHNTVFDKLEFDCPLLFNNEKIKNKFVEFANFFMQSRGNKSYNNDKKKTKVLKLMFSEYGEISQNKLDDEVKAQIKTFFDTMLDAYDISDKKEVIL